MADSEYKIGTYSGNPSTSRKDLLRFLISDTDCSRLLFSDDEINYVGDNNLDDCVAQSILFSTLAGRYSLKANTTVGDVSKNFSDIAKSYREQSRECLDLAGARAATLATAFFGGITHSGNAQLNEDSDGIKPEFPLDLGNSPFVRQLNSNVLFGDDD